MNSVERVKTICKERKILISKVERDLGYANGYIGQQQSYESIQEQVRKKGNAGNPYKYGILDILSSERAGIRTPDNLIKSQVLKYPQTPEI